MEKKQLFKLGLWFRAKQIVKNIKSWSDKHFVHLLSSAAEPGDLVDVMEAVCL